MGKQQELWPELVRPEPKEDDAKEWQTADPPVTFGKIANLAAEEGTSIAGLELRFTNDTIWIVGDVNEAGGSCGCCCMFGDSDKIKAYRRLT